jgi:hypothetical protein
MTIFLCILAAIGLFAVTVLVSREFVKWSPFRLSWGLHGLSLLLILVALATRGIWYDANTYFGDLWTVYDSLWKTAQGLRSSIDYFSPIGPVMQWLFAITSIVQSPSASSIVLANVLVAIISLLLAIVLLRHRATPLTIALTGLIAVTTALTSRDIDSIVPAAQSDFLSPYNRWGWALLVPVAMRAALPLARPDLAGAILSGAAIALLILLKITYGIAALGVYVLATVVQPKRWREGLAVVASLMAILLIADILSGGQVRGYLADLRMTAQMPFNGVRLGKLISELPIFVLFALGSLLLLLAATRDGIESPPRLLLLNWRPIFIAFATGGAGLVVLMQNHYSTEATTLLLMPLIIAEWTGLSASPWTESPDLLTKRAEWIGLVLLVALSGPAIDAGFIIAQKVQLARKSRIPELAGTGFHDLVIESTHLPTAEGACGDSTCVDYRRMLSGRALLGGDCPERKDLAILALSFSNPFPALLGAKSPKGAPIWLHFGRSFSAEVHPTAKVLLGDVGCILQAKGGDDSSVALMNIYGVAIREAFRPTAQNAQWQLWTRKDD